MGSLAVGVSRPFLIAEPGAARRIPLSSHFVPASSEAGWRLFAPSSLTGSARALRVQVVQAPKVSRDRWVGASGAVAGGDSRHGGGAAV